MNYVNAHNIQGSLTLCIPMEREEIRLKFTGLWKFRENRSL